MSMPRASHSTPKALLITRSGLGRLRLRREARAVSESLHPRRAFAAVAATPAAQRIAFALFLAVAGPRRTGRILAVAGRVVFFAGLARAVLAVTRKGPAKGP